MDEQSGESKEEDVINQSIMIFSVAQIVNYYWDHDSVYGKTIECGGMICEREMSLAGYGKQLKKVMTECPMVENSKERKQLQETSAARR